MKKQIVNTSELAKWLKLTGQRVRELTRDGVLTQIGRAKYDLRLNVGNYIEYQRSKSSTTVRDSFVQEKELTQRIIRRQKELELAKAQGELLDRKKTLLIITNAIATLKSHVLAIAPRCAQKCIGLKSRVEANTVIRPECERALISIADLDTVFLVRQSLNGSNGTHDTKKRRRKNVR